MKNTILTSSLLFLGLVLMSGVIDLGNLFNYGNQVVPTYIVKDNAPASNQVSDAGATLGRVLFYDKALSNDNTIACSSCHLQEFAFGDTAQVSTGVAGVTGRHSMRLVNARFSNEVTAFWDEREPSFEDQATKPIRDHVEMGFSGANGDPTFNDLLAKLDTIEYYNTLFEFVYGDTIITEARIQNALAQFVRSIQSFDSKYDIGRAQVAGDYLDFPNFTIEENLGKELFFDPPPSGGAGCFRCHTGSEFSILPTLGNNGVIGVANSAAIDLTNTKAPSLRDLMNPQGILNGPFMHDGSLETLMDVVDHYNDLVEVPQNTNLDSRLQGAMHDLNLTLAQREALVAFLKTLTGSAIYTEEKWSDPFDAQGNITVNNVLSVIKASENSFDLKLFPNPIQEELNVSLKEGKYHFNIFTVNGKEVRSRIISGNHVEDFSELPTGIFFVKIQSGDKVIVKKVVKE